MRFPSNRTLFRIWGSLAGPLVLGCLWIAFQTNLWLGITFLSCALLWFYDMGATTCSRCANYGTLHCGIQGRLVPFLFKRRSMQTASRWRIRVHRMYDILMMCFAVAIYSQVLWLLPIMMLWSILGLIVVYGSGQHHGLLHKLRIPVDERANEPSQLVTLQNLTDPTESPSDARDSPEKSPQVPLLFRGVVHGEDHSIERTGK